MCYNSGRKEADRLEQRVNPDVLLKQIESQSQQGNRGHLKIFFGYAAGVGKTYAML